VAPPVPDFWEEREERGEERRRGKEETGSWPHVAGNAATHTHAPTSYVFGRGVDDGKVELRVGRVERRKEVENFGLHFAVQPGRVAVDLMECREARRALKKEGKG
jgi:hypothetical protein